MSKHSASMHLKLTDEPFAMCHTYGTTRTPILLVRDAHASMHLSGEDGLPSEEHLKFAQQLTRAAAEYLAAVETYTGTRKVV